MREREKSSKMIYCKKEDRKKGDVFLPRKWSKKLLTSIDKSCFGNTDYVFFEPCCGTGNIVLEIINKQITAFMEKLEDKKDYEKIEDWGNISVIQTISNLYAIDINPYYIKICRKRALNLINFRLNKFLSSGKASNNSYFQNILKRSLNYHIFENEMFSALEPDYHKAKEKVKATKASKEWFKKNPHLPINFNLNFFTDHTACK